MAITNDPALANQMVRLRSHGITRDPVEMTHAPDGPWYYQQLGIGFNYRMTDLQAALGLSQMQRLDEFVAKRHELAEYYNKLLSKSPVKIPWQSEESYSALHLYIIRLQQTTVMFTRQEVFERLRINGIGVNLHYIPVYRHPFYECMGFNRDDFPEAERYYKEAITLPLYPTLTKEQQQEIVQKLTTPIGHQAIF